MLSTMFELHHDAPHHHITSFEASNTFSTQAKMPSSCNDGLHLHIIMTKDSKCGGQGTTVAGGAVAAGKAATGEDAAKGSENPRTAPPDDSAKTNPAENSVAPESPIPTKPGTTEKTPAPEDKEVNASAQFLVAPRWENWREQRTKSNDFL